jgi:hypothetical protein
MMAGRIPAHVEQVVEAHLGDALDLAQALGDFIGALVFQAARKGGDDVLARQALPVGPLTARMKGKPNLAL